MLFKQMSRYSNQAIYFVFLKNDNVCGAGQNECGIAQPMWCRRSNSCWKNSQGNIQVVGHW